MGSNWDIVRWAMEKRDHMQRRITCQSLDAAFYIYFSWDRGVWLDCYDLSYFPDFNRGKWRKWEPKQDDKYKCFKCQDSGVILIEYTDPAIGRRVQTCGCQIKQEPKTVVMWQYGVKRFGQIHLSQELLPEPKAEGVGKIIGWVKVPVEMVDSEGEGE